MPQDRTKVFSFLLFFCFIYHSFAEIINNEDINTIEQGLLVHTNSGPIKGVVVKSFTGKVVTAFYGIPYAEPPIGNLRFKPPTPVKPWTDVFEASTKPTQCYQQRVNNWKGFLSKRPWSEDCLKLNIWVPKTNPQIEEQKIPVFLYIHGGAFLFDTSTIYSDGATLASEGKIYVVTFNYRLAAFGFLYYGHPEAPGNMGLMDQQLAIKWVHKNTQHFGKNTGSIILSGVGSGSASVNYHILARGSAGLFKTAIVRSGVALDLVSFSDVTESKKTAQSMAEKLGCKRENIADEIECLRNAHPEDIIDASVMELHSMFSPKQFKPTVDGEFLAQSPLQAFEEGNFNNVSIMCSTMADEGSTLLSKIEYDLLVNASHAGISKEVFRELLKRISLDLTKTDLNLVENMYLDDCVDDPFKILDAAVKVYTDVYFACPANLLMDLVTKHNVNAYRTVFEQKLSFNPKWMGSVHATDFLLFFGNPLRGDMSRFTEEEKQISLAFMHRLSRLMHSRAEDIKKLTALYSLEDRKYVIFTAGGVSSLHKDYRGRECTFWQKTLPQLQAARKACSKNN